MENGTVKQKTSMCQLVKKSNSLNAYPVYELYANIIK